MSTSSRLDMLTESFEKVLAYGLRPPDISSFESYFPDLPTPVVEALLDLYRQVLLHVEINSKAEFADIAAEHAVKEQLAEIEQLCAQPQHALSSLHASSSASPAALALAAEAHARITAKQSETAFLQLELARLQSERDSLAAAQQQRQAQVQQLAAGYQAVAGSMKMVYTASKGALQQSV